MRVRRADGVAIVLQGRDARDGSQRVAGSQDPFSETAHAANMNTDGHANVGVGIHAIWYKLIQR